MQVKCWMDYIAKIYCMENNDIVVEFTDNLFERRVELMDLKYVDEFKRQESVYRNSNGCICEPNRLQGEWRILISTQSEKFRRGEWMSTLAHEMSHVDDYMKFANYFDLKSFRDIMIHKYYAPFFVWTEYKAKSIGYNFLLVLYHSDEKDYNKIRKKYQSLYDERQPIRYEKLRLKVLADIMEELAEYNMVNKIFGVQYDVDIVLRNFPKQEKERMVRLHNMLRACMMDHRKFFEIIEDIKSEVSPYK